MQFLFLSLFQSPLSVSLPEPVSAVPSEPVSAVPSEPVSVVPSEPVSVVPSELPLEALSELLSAALSEVLSAVRMPLKLSETEHQEHLRGQYFQNHFLLPEQNKVLRHMYTCVYAHIHICLHRRM